MADTVVDPVVEGQETKTQEEKKVVQPSDDLRRIKKANAALQKERDDFKAKLDKAEKDAQDAKLTEVEKYQKLVKQHQDEAALAKQEAAAAKKEREYERKVSLLVAKYKLADPEYGDMVLKGYNPEEHDDFDEYVKEVKKKPAIARLFGTVEDRIVNEDGSDIEPKVAGSQAKQARSSSWEEREREIAESLYPNNKARQDAYIAGLKKLRGGK